jgi:hypothetical protein
MVAIKSEFKGTTVLELRKNEEDRFPFSFGLNKAKLILENIEEIKKFVEEESNKNK